jgi:MFS family permease
VVTSVATLFVGIGMMAMFFVIPLLTEAARSTGYGFGLDATGAAVLLVPGAVMMTVVGPLAAATGVRAGHRLALALGQALTAGSLLVLAFRHATQPEVLLLATIALAGAGFALAALPNLVFDSVGQHRSGEAISFNFVVLRFGSALGSQIGASILAASAVASSAVPTDSGFTQVFAFSAAVATFGGLCAVVIPRAREARAGFEPAISD